MSYIIKDVNGVPVIREGKEVRGRDYPGVIKGVDLNERMLRIIGTDETKDRDGDIISVSGWILENYLKNPVFLWAHDYRSVPIGRTEKLIRRKKPSDHLEFNIRFPSQGVYPFADLILQLYSEKIINASSVGFIPMEWEDIDETLFMGGLRFLKQELLELSGCAVPSNPSALQNAIKGLVHEGTNEALLSKYIMGELVPELNFEQKDFDAVQNDLDSVSCSYEEETDKVQVQVPEKIEARTEEEGVGLEEEGPESDKGEVGQGQTTEPSSEEPAQVNSQFLVNFTPEAHLQFLDSEPGKYIWAGEYREEGGILISDMTTSPAENIYDQLSENERKWLLDGYLKEHMAEKYPAIAEGKADCLIKFFQYDGKQFVLIREEVIDLKDYNVTGKAGAVLSQKNRDRLLQAKNLLDEVLAEASSEPGEVQEEHVESDEALKIKLLDLADGFAKLSTTLNSLKELATGV